MIVAVTGASGLVGANIVRSLLDAGISVRTLVHHNQQAIAGLNVETVQADIENLQSLIHAFRGVDAVVHAAGHVSLRRGDWDKVYRLNVLATRYVAQACLAASVPRLIHISSVHAHQQYPLEIPLDENRPLALDHQFSPYDRSKAMAELEITLAAQSGLNTTILKPTAVIGPHDYRPTALGKAIWMLGRGKWPVVIEGGFDWVDGRDVGKAVCLALNHAPPNAQYLITGTWTSVLDLADRISQITHGFCPKIAFPFWLARIATPAADLAADIFHFEPVFTSVSLDALRSNHHIVRLKAEKELGYFPRSLDDTLLDTLEWFRQHTSY